MEVSSETVLDDLAASILEAFNFDNDHLYQFAYKNRYGFTEYIVHPEMDSDDQNTYDFVVGDLPLYKGTELTFHFDFGDDWRFLLTVDSIENKISDPKPKVTEKHGRPPKQYSGF